MSDTATHNAFMTVRTFNCLGAMLEGNGVPYHRESTTVSATAEGLVDGVPPLITAQGYQAFKARDKCGLLEAAKEECGCSTFGSKVLVLRAWLVTAIDLIDDPRAE